MSNDKSNRVVRLLWCEYIRRSLRLKQADVAVLADIPQPTYSLIEQGRFLPTKDDRDRLDHALDIQPDHAIREFDTSEDWRNRFPAYRGD